MWNHLSIHHCRKPEFISWEICFSSQVWEAVCVCSVLGRPMFYHFGHLVFYLLVALWQSFKSFLFFVRSPILDARCPITWWQQWCFSLVIPQTLFLLETAYMITWRENSIMTQRIGGKISFAMHLGNYLVQWLQIQLCLKVSGEFVKLLSSWTN